MDQHHEMAPGMGIGLGLPQVDTFADPVALREVAAWAEREGFASLWTIDRLIAPLDEPGAPASVLDPFVALTLAAAVTDRIRLGSVAVAPLYAPVVLGRAAASVDRVSGGRLTLGLGLGRSTADLAAAGAARGGRQVRIEQVLEVLARVWRDEVVDIETSRELVVPSRIGLKPVQQPRVPLLLTTSRPAGLERIARRADGWIATGLRFDAIAERWAGILRIAERYGRAPATLRLVVRADVRVCRVGATRAPFTGSLSQISDDIERAREVGAHEVVLDLQQTASSTRELQDLALHLAAGSLTRATDRKAA
jgi:probable F420-dependent oxidoreductase